MMNNRGEMGVGTLIIFIALLLVAAVAAGVLIQTASSLQQKALSTGTQATTQVSTNAQVVEVSGTDGTSSLQNFSITTQLAPGSDPIDFNAVTITFGTSNTTTTFRYSGSAVFATNATNANGTFGITYLQSGTNHQSGYFVRGDVVRIDLSSPRAIGNGESARIAFIPKVGSQTLTLFTVPDVISTQRVYLYP